MQTLFDKERLLVKLDGNSDKRIYIGTTDCHLCHQGFDAESLQNNWTAITAARVKRDRHLVVEHDFKPKRTVIRN